MKFFLFLLLFMISSVAFGQNFYHYGLKKEGVLLGTSALMVGSSFYLDSRANILSEGEILSAVPSVNSFDRKALDYSSATAKDASDILFYASSALPFAFLTSGKLKGERLQYLLMFGETVGLNGGLTYLVKSLTDRKRPYFYNNSFTLEERSDLDARKSFFSGHASHSAAMCFFTASVFSDLYPSSKWKPIVWIGAATIPAATAYFRVRAGRHFPTDVLVGYCVGAGIGSLIPFLHKRPRAKDRALNLGFSGNGLVLSYQL